MHQNQCHRMKLSICGFYAHQFHCGFVQFLIAAKMTRKYTVTFNAMASFDN